MTLRADHVAGGSLVGFGLLIIALSGDLPFGDLAMPGAGFMPIIIAVLIMIFGAALLVRARESAPLGSIDWSDAKHAAMVIAITAAAVALYERLGFSISMLLMILGFLIVIERRNPVRAAIFAFCVVALTLALFVYALQTPLAEGPLGF